MSLTPTGFSTDFSIWILSLSVLSLPRRLSPPSPTPTVCLHLFDLQMNEARSHQRLYLPLYPAYSTSVQIWTLLLTFAKALAALSHMATFPWMKSCGLTLHPGGWCGRDPSKRSLRVCFDRANMADDPRGFRGLHFSKNIFMNMKSTSAYIILPHREDL